MIKIEDGEFGFELKTNNTRIPTIYLINYNDNDRLNEMKQRFNRLGIMNIKIPEPVHLNDKRFEFVKPTEPRTWAIMMQHLDALKDFIFTSITEGNEDEEYCIICEDDILISKDLIKEIPNITKHMVKYELDVLLLGYLLPFKIEPNEYYKPIEPYRFYEFPDDQWGSQMYIITKKHAIDILKTYNIKWAVENPDKPFSPDWILTKKGKRALIYPPLAIENGLTKTFDEHQQIFHKRCFEVNYKEDIFI